MRKSLRIEAFASVMLVLLILIVTLMSSFFLTALLYTILKLTPPSLLVYLINSLLGLVLFALIMMGFSFWISTRGTKERKRIGRFEPIFEAMERIATGDFQVRLDARTGNNILTSELAKSVNQMANELSQMEHLRQEFISNVSHEIQSPLTSIRGFARALYDENLSLEKKHHYLAIIETESMRLSRMTDNMLKLASLESEYMQIEAVSYRLDKQIRAVILGYEPQWMGKNLDIEADLQEVEIHADKDLLSQVWSNLIHNSIKFTPEGGKVRVEMQQRDCLIKCKITDTGIGIPEEAQRRIFERFYKVDTARKRTYEGSGLGLTITQKIVDLHHGTIEVTSTSGTGTTFIVSLPVK